MAERIQIDPSKIPCPNFASGAYAFMRDALIADNNNPDITNHEEATNRLRSEWETENNARHAEYLAQVQADEELAAQRRREVEEIQQQREGEKRQREAETAKEAEKKRTPLYSLKSGTSITSFPQHIHPYAKKKMSQRKFVELWYFTPEAYAEAKEQRSNVESNRFELAADDERKGAATFTLVGTHSTKPSSNAVPDAMLTWAQISRAKSAFLNALPIGNYSSEYIAMFAGFYTNMDMHEELQKPKGDLVMAQYHADMRRAWFAAYEDGEPFDLAVISAEALQLSREEVRNKAHERALAGRKNLS
ncbi:hypothetical protein DFJ43DRAFT_1043908 [Lentinula guzmanii]|uniref:Uncharacterized protein n=3 Tax=Lentinula TaxID=5352 RepID=A0AA38JEZ4_9AGAR|nr:hypothetical protein DFJ43DRAFT_1043908 [Lentinula guzmanii]KAJ3779537.1 hypothetical protein GGU10DRAFT_34699 [Lentinula aff. detonsa]KAJ3792010.1 hypothetical protein GGU11DRAFT_593244 [Lentinula aff. detonsa]